jgi:Translation initiation factor IF-2, N-terminal region
VFNPIEAYASELSRTGEQFNVVDTTKIRINDLARELEVRSICILGALPFVNVTEKKTHSSSITVEEAERIRAFFQGDRVLPFASELLRKTRRELTQVEEKSAGNLDSAPDVQYKRNAVKFLEAWLDALQSRQLLRNSSAKIATARMQTGPSPLDTRISPKVGDLTGQQNLKQSAVDLVQGAASDEELSEAWASQLGSARRLLTKLMNEMEGIAVETEEEKIGRRISRLIFEKKIPRPIGGFMHAIVGYRNESEYKFCAPSSTDLRAIDAAWKVIVNWTEVKRMKIAPAMKKWNGMQSLLLAKAAHNLS